MGTSTLDSQALASRRIARRAPAPLSPLQASACLAVWAAAWLLLVLLTSLSPPVDNAEQLSWVRSLAWGYYKHPPLPTMVLWPWVQLFGIHEWVSYATAGLVTGSAVLIGRQLTREVCGQAVADLATLGTLCIGFYSLRLPYFNHDTLLLLCVAVAAWACWRAFVRRSLAAWAVLGLALGLGALAKYQVVLAALSVLVFWTAEQGWRDALHRRGLALAALLAVLIFSPHGAWLLSHDFLPLQYAAQNSLAEALSPSQCAKGVLKWVGDQLSQLCGALLLGAGLLISTGRRDQAPAVKPQPPETRARVFMLCWGVLPLLLIPLMALPTHAKLHMNWGAPYMLLTCAALMLFIGRQTWAAVNRRHALLGFAAVQLLLMAAVLINAQRHPPALHQHRTARFDAQTVADRIGPAARQALAGEIRVIAGRQSLASVLSLRLPERPLVLIDGRHDISPWVPTALSSACGVLWVGGPEDKPPMNAQRREIDEGLWWAVELPSGQAIDCPRAGDNRP